MVDLIKTLLSGADLWVVEDNGPDRRTMKIPNVTIGRYGEIRSEGKAAIDLPVYDMHNGMSVTAGHFFEPAIGTDLVGANTKPFMLNGTYVGNTIPWLRGKRALVMIDADQSKHCYVQFDDWETFYSHGWWHFPTVDFYLDINGHEDRKLLL